MVGINSLILNILRLESPPKGSFRMGKFSGGTPFIISHLTHERVEIGKFCSIAAGVVMIPMVGHIPPREHRTRRISTFPLARLKRNGWKEKYALPNEAGSVVVGNDVWIGANVIIPGGLRIGTGAIVAAGAVVVKDVPPYAVVGGNPAKIIRYRFSEEQIKSLLESEWWNWPLERIRQRVGDFSDIEKFRGSVTS